MHAKLAEEGKLGFEEMRDFILEGWSSRHVLNQFNLLKEIINKNSIPNEILVRKIGYLLLRME